ncbi:acyl carrier protein [Catenulispora sp. EB89]|uniref:4'-phosphopantetheinyl transferase superfamily protein n=1 Tax=Catenulispora sp. EB89 TaxID=3156257 RepID=UPI0035164FFE
MRIGVDLMSVSRFARVAEHRRYRALVFTERELSEAGQLGSARCLERLAGRFCVKEATCKLLGRGFGQGLRWPDIEVCADDWGAPAVALSGGARRLADEAGIGDIAVALTHQVDLVMAVAASDRGRPPSPYRAAPREQDAGAGAVGGLDDVARMAAEVFGSSEIHVAAAESFAGDLGATSALTIELLTRLEEHYGVRIPEPDFYQMTDLPGTRRAVARAVASARDAASVPEPAAAVG